MKRMKNKKIKERRIIRKRDLIKNRRLKKKMKNFLKNIRKWEEFNILSVPQL